MKTRNDQMLAGKIWHVYRESDPKTKILFEGSRTACLKFLRDAGLWRDYRNGSDVRLGKLIWENICAREIENEMDKR